MINPKPNIQISFVLVCPKCHLIFNPSNSDSSDDKKCPHCGTTGKEPYPQNKTEVIVK